ARLSRLRRAARLLRARRRIRPRRDIGAMGTRGERSRGRGPSARGFAPDRRHEMGAESRRIVDAWGPKRFAAGLSEACGYALQQPARKLSMADRVLFRAMARFWISKVT